jgi:integrase
MEPHDQLPRRPQLRQGRIYPRGKRGILWIAYYDADGCERRESSRSTDPRQADRLLRQRLVAKERGERYLRPRRLTLSQLLDGLREHYTTQASRSWPRFSHCCDRLTEHFGAECRISRLDHDALEGYIRARLAVAAPATIRLELRVLSAAFKIGMRRKWVPAAPLFPTVHVANTRTACFTDAELAALLHALPEPIRSLTEFGSLTGWRLRECLRLRWSSVNFEDHTIRLHPAESKSGRGRVFPFRTLPALAALLQRQRAERWRIERERGVAVEFVFHRQGRPIVSHYDVWEKACAQAGLHDRRFHDLRRYAAQRLVRAGVARSEAMALLGHQTESMFVRYAINDLPMLERAVGKIAALSERKE